MYPMSAYFNEYNIFTNKIKNKINDKIAQKRG